MTERRYSESEVERIFRRAAEAQQQQRGPVPLASGDGMTLDTLLEIGAEVGLPPDLIAREARAVDMLGEPSTRRLLGLPIGVGRTVTLPRRLDDAAWERLVVDLRTTFDARGRIQQDGAFRQWTNGNLQALVEPRGDGTQVRLRTVNGNARWWMSLGLVCLALAGVFFAAYVVGGAPVSARMAGVLMPLGLIGLGGIATGALRLPGWSRTRRKQMEEIAARLSADVERDA